MCRLYLQWVAEGLSDVRALDLNELSDEITQLSNHVEMLQRQSQEKSILLLTQTSIILGVMTFRMGSFGTMPRTAASNRQLFIRTVKQLPRPGSLSTEMVPPCASMMAFAMARPMPDPPVLRLLEASVR